MGNIDRANLTDKQLSVEKLIKEQNFNWKVKEFSPRFFGLGLRRDGACLRTDGGKMSTLSFPDAKSETVRPTTNII